MKVKIAYGKTGLDVNFKDEWNVTIVEPKFVNELANPPEALSNALNNPYDSLPIKKLVDKDSKVGIIFSDITRPMPRKVIIQAILNELDFLSNDNIILFNALGTHRENTKEELIDMLGETIYNGYKIVQNNAFDKSTQTYLGKSSNDHDIWLNAELINYDLLVMTGFIEPHFFAGFSGGGKSIMPGMAGLETVLGNHDAKMISNPNSTWAITEGNPIWEEVNEVSKKIKNKFLLNVTLNSRKEITGVFAGNLIQAHKAGCDFVKESSMVPVDQKFDIVVTSNSGYPLDLNLYQAIKGVSAAAQIVKEGGAIIIAADCWDGIPEHGLYGNLIKEASSVQRIT